MALTMCGKNSLRNKRHDSIQPVIQGCAQHFRRIKRLFKIKPIKTEFYIRQDYSYVQSILVPKF